MSVLRSVQNWIAIEPMCKNNGKRVGQPTLAMLSFGIWLGPHTVKPLRITFQFDPEKAVQAMAYLLSQLNGTTEKVKLMKLLFLADKKHFLDCGYPITGDVQYALPKGPVPTNSLNLLNFEYHRDWDDPVLEAMSMEGHSVALKASPGTARLTASEIATLNSVVKEHGNKHRWKLVEETHQLPEYKDVYVERSSRPIPYELILRHHGGNDRFRHNRPVIGQDTIAHMLCPFDSSDADL